MVEATDFVAAAKKPFTRSFADCGKQASYVTREVPASESKRKGNNARSDAERRKERQEAKEIFGKIVMGKIGKFYSENCLLEAGVRKGRHADGRAGYRQKV